MFGQTSWKLTVGGIVGLSVGFNVGTFAIDEVGIVVELDKTNDGELVGRKVGFEVGVLR